MFAIKGTKVLQRDEWFSTPLKVESWWTGYSFGAGHFKKKFTAKDLVEREMDRCLTWMRPRISDMYHSGYEEHPRSEYKLEVIDIGD